MVEATVDGEPQPRPDARPAATRHTVLLVEDDPLVRAVVLRMLDADGFRILEASDGDEALALSDAEEPGAIDLLIADTVIPGPGGLELARRIRPRHPAIRTLVMSGYSETIATPDIALEPGTAFIAKPFSHADLNVKLAALLAGRFDPAAGSGPATG